MIAAGVGYAATAIVLVGILSAWADPVSGSLTHAAALLLGAICCGLAVGTRTPLLSRHWLILPPLICALWGTVQALGGWTAYSYATWNSATAWLARAVLFSAGYIGFRDARRRRRLQTLLLWFGGVFSLLAVLQWYSGNGSVLWVLSTDYDAEVAGTFLNRDQFAVLVELLLPFAVARAFAPERNSSPLPFLACAGTMFAAVVASGSRTGTILVTLEALVFVAIACRGNRRQLGIAALTVAALFGSTLVAGWSYVWDRFTTGDLFAFRREMLVSTLHMIRERPFAGFGLGTWPTVYPAFAIFDPPKLYMNHAHNDWAEWAAEGGILFALPLLGAACAAVWLARKQPWALGITAVFAHALVDFPFQKPALACAVFFLLGVLAASVQRKGISLSPQKS